LAYSDFCILLQKSHRALKICHLAASDDAFGRAALPQGLPSFASRSGMLRNHF
jgi:hypothetical protein